MADYTQAAVDTLLTHQAITHPGTVVGTAVSVATNLFASAWVQVGRVETVTPVQITIKIQATPEGADNEDWQDLIVWRTNTTGADNETLSGVEAVGATVLNVAATAGFEAEQYIYIQDTGVVTDGEWAEVQEIVTNTSIDILDGLKNAKDGADIIYNEAERFKININCAALSRVRAVVIHEAATGPNIHVIGKLLRVTAIE